MGVYLLVVSCLLTVNTIKNILSVIDNDALGYNITYTIFPTIQIKDLEEILPNIEYVKSEDGTNLVGFRIKISNGDLNEAKKEANNIADRIVSFITYKTSSYVSYINTGVSGIPKLGKTAKVEKSAVIHFDIEGSSTILKLHNLDTMDILKLDDEQHELLHRFAQAVSSYTSNLPIDAFRELFAIIEYEKGFNDYEKYYGLRQILFHRPDLTRSEPYWHKTIEKFTNHFNENDFDYIEYNPTANTIRINKNSQKTKMKMDNIVSELLFSTQMKDFIQNKCNFSNPST